MRLHFPSIQPRLVPALLVALGLLQSSCNLAGLSGDDPKGTIELTILYTNDEHGWMEGEFPGQGAAEMLSLWENVEGLTADGSYLIMSGGDMWTGPAISTWYQGKSMVEVMNGMGYHAAAVGNHEFDFQTDALMTRAAEADFPYLSANIRLKSTGETPSFAQPFAILEVSDFRVGVIGLTTTSTTRSAFPAYVADFRFMAYDSALIEVVPDVKAAGVDLMVIISHVCFNELESLRMLAEGLGISVLAGGHCHDARTSLIDGVAIVEAGSFLRTYARIDLGFSNGKNARDAQLIPLEVVIKTNQGGATHAAIAGLIAPWRAMLDLELSEVIGYSTAGFDRGSPALYNLIPDAWLWAYPQAEVAASNYGGFRQGINAGDIIIEDIVGVLPFDNKLVILDMGGEALVNFANSSGVALGGFSIISGANMLDGTPIHPDSIYTLVVTDYMYSFEVNPELSTADDTPILTDVNWRDPLIDWLRYVGSSPAQPLEQFLDSTPRRAAGGGN